jgi:pimeloyl-ACP methyl ester carboxylesterase
MIHHYPETFLEPLAPGVDPKSTSAMLARDPGGKAVIFIHGYGGNAITTWGAFNTLLPLEEKAKDYDFIFYGYDGIRNNTFPSAQIVYQFLDQLFNQPLGILNPHLSLSGKRTAGFTYNKVILAAHSLGTVLVRWTLLTAHETDKNHPWANKISTILYAPAHMGASVDELALQLAAGKDFISAIFHKLHIAGQFFSPLIAELKANSPMLLQLQQHTAQAIKDGCGFAIPQKVILAEKDRIVDNIPFVGDPLNRYVTIPGSTHTSVCKPSRDFLEPFDYLTKIL